MPSGLPTVGASRGIHPETRALHTSSGTVRESIGLTAAARLAGPTLASPAAQV